VTAPNRNALWSEILVEELVAAGVTSVCIAPGSRSTPLTVAFARHDDVAVFSHLDERSAAFFALGRAKRTGVPTPVVCTSGTAAANFHPAVVEADQFRVPLLVLTADRPPELRDTGANQTIDQEKLYGDAVRWYADLPEPRPEPRTLRSLRTSVARSVAAATGTPPGPVHLNVPFRKPLEPTEVPGDVPADLASRDPEAVAGRDGPYVRTTAGVPTLDESDLEAVRSAVSSADRGLLVAGPTDRPAPSRDALAVLVDATGFPVMADPLSGHRFGGHVPDLPIVGGYDGFFDERVTADWADPEVVVRFGASPTSKVLREYLARIDARQFVVDSAGEWREATFTATDLVVADETRFARALADGLDAATDDAWRDGLLDAESRYWDLLADERGDTLFEGAVLAETAALAPDPATLFVSSSMPVRDVDRFGRPRAADLTVLGNRGASGIDGVTSTALGAGSATDDPLVLVTGDLAYYHDTNGLLALERCGVDATIVLINNDGGGIFHMLPIEEFDPPFTAQFKTPHGLDFEPTGDLYDLDFSQVESLAGFRDAYQESVESGGRQVIEVVTDAEASHRFREQLCERVVHQLDS
jgi:2-succinyl-5-enolpyruvyl-6-hydroxy-3-cyclohexene-1-carboxylate synthase